MKQYIKFDEYFIFRYIWLIVILPKELQTMALISLLVILLIKKSIVRFDVLTIIILIYFFIHFTSIVFNVHTHNFEIIRIIASLNTAILWALSTLYYTYYSNKSLNIETLGEICYFNIKILIYLSVISLILFYIFNINRVSILGCPLYGIEWFNSKPTLRFGGLLEYANLVVFFYLMFFPLAFNYLINNKSKFKIIFYILLSFIPIFITLSRSGYITIILLIFIYLGYSILKFCDKRTIILILVVLLSVFIIAFTYFDLQSKVIEEITSLINSRQGSNSTRGYLYSESIRITNENSPIIGQGIKVISSTGYPLGSHSTYIGFYYKAGILGLTSGILIFLTANFKLIRKVADSYGHFLITTSLLLQTLMLFVEDLDGASWVIVVYFSFIGVVTKRQNWNKKGIKYE